MSESPSAANTGSRNLRILLLSQFYPPDIGGVEVHVQALARGLVARGHEVVVATLSTSEFPPGERLDEGVRVRTLQGTMQRIGVLFTTDRRHAPPFPDPELESGLKRLVAEFRPDVVHAHNWIGRSYVPLKRRLGVPYLVSLHDSGRICTQARMWRNNRELCPGPSVGACLSCCAAQFGWLKGTVTYVTNRAARGPEARAVDLFLPVSTAVAASNHLAEDRLRYEVVPNFSVDAQPSGECTDERLRELPDEPFILQVGDVMADKGVDVLFEAYAAMASPPPLVLIGRIDEATRARLPRGALATGPWSHDLVLEAWSRSLFGTMPSLCLDACPTVTFEAMAAARPVIASARGGLLDQVVDGVTGILVPPGDAAALAQAMMRLGSDAALRGRLGEASRARFESEFQADVVIDRVEALYRGLTCAS